MTCRKFITNTAINFEPIAKKISAILFVLVLVGAILSERENIVSYFSQAGPITLALNIIMMIIAFFLAKFLGSGEQQKKLLLSNVDFKTEHLQ